jgi:hypothetical protein
MIKGSVKLDLVQATSLDHPAPNFAADKELADQYKLPAYISLNLD